MSDLTFNVWKYFLSLSVFVFISSQQRLELDDTLDVLAVGVGILGGEVDRLANSESDRLLGLARRTSVT